MDAEAVLVIVSVIFFNFAAAAPVAAPATAARPAASVPAATRAPATRAPPAPAVNKSGGGAELALIQELTVQKDEAEEKVGILLGYNSSSRFCSVFCVVLCCILNYLTIEE